MTSESLNRLLARAESVLDRLIQVQTARQMALARLDPGELERLSREESAETDAFAAVLDQREALLAQANHERGPEEVPLRTLRDLAARFRGPQGPALAARIERIDARARQLRDLATENWLVAYRSARQVQESAQALMPFTGTHYDQPGFGEADW